MLFFTFSSYIIISCNADFTQPINISLLLKRGRVQSQRANRSRRKADNPASYPVKVNEHRRFIEARRDPSPPLPLAYPLVQSYPAEIYRDSALMRTIPSPSPRLSHLELSASATDRYCITAVTPSSRRRTPANLISVQLQMHRCATVS